MFSKLDIYFIVISVIGFINLGFLFVYYNHYYFFYPTFFAALLITLYICIFVYLSFLYLSVLIARYRFCFGERPEVSVSATVVYDDDGYVCINTTPPPYREKKIFHTVASERPNFKRVTFETADTVSNTSCNSIFPIISRSSSESLIFEKLNSYGVHTI